MNSGLPAGSEQVVESAELFRNWQLDAYNHLSLRIDQLGKEDWEMRLYAWDASWGWEWSTYFAQTIACVVQDMVKAPTRPLLGSKTAAVQKELKRKGDDMTNAADDWCSAK